MKRKFLLLSILALSVFTACEKEENNSLTGEYLNGALIINEGNFGKSNASVDFYSYNENKIFNGIFESKNNRPLGDVLQSIFIDFDKTYLVLNQSNKIEIVKTGTFEEIGIIDGLKSPRYMTIADNKAFISQWGDNGTIAVYDLNKQEITNTINVGEGAEAIMHYNNVIWLANGGYFSPDNRVMVIDPKTETVVKEITVGDNPKEMVVDANKNIWVLCNGNIVYDASYNVVSQTPSKLVVLSSNNYEIVKEIKISETLHPMHLDINKEGTIIYYGGGFGFDGIFAIPYESTAAPTSALISGYFYGFNVNPKNNQIFCCDAGNFTANSKLQIYDSEGTKIGEMESSIGANGVYFQ